MEKGKEEPIVSLKTVAIVLLVALLLLSFVKPVQPQDVDEEAKPVSKSAGKLQIGIKKRVENCDRKSRKGDLLHIHYRGYLKDGGTEFDNSYKRGSPLTFTLGQGQVIKGWDMGLMGVCEGEKRKLTIPPELGYGSSGAGASIPPNAVLVFEVEVMKIEDKNHNDL